MVQRSTALPESAHFTDEVNRILDMEVSVDQVVDNKSSVEWVGDATPAEVIAYLRSLGFERKIEVNVDIKTTKGYSSTLEAYVTHKDGRHIGLWMETDLAFGNGVCIYDAVYGSSRR